MIKNTIKATSIYFLATICAFDLAIISDLLVHKVFYENSIALFISFLIWPFCMAIMAYVVVILADFILSLLAIKHMNYNIYILAFSFSTICLSFYILENLIIKKYVSSDSPFINAIIIPKENITSYFAWFISLGIGMFLYGSIRIKYWKLKNNIIHNVK